MKVLILVLSAMREPWGEMLRTQKETWDSEVHPQTETLYSCGKFDGFRGIDCEKIYFSPTLSEELEEISGRTIEALEYALKLDWDFIARPHSSTYVHKRNLVDFIETLPKENVLCGLLTTGEAPYLWGGGSYIISRDVVEKFVANKDKWNFGVMEDGSITEMANELGIPFTKGRMASIDGQSDGSFLCTTYGTGEGGFSFTDWGDVKKLHPHYYFRCKQDLYRHRDLEIMRNLHKHL